MFEKPALRYKKSHNLYFGFNNLHYSFWRLLFLSVRFYGYPGQENCVFLMAYLQLLKLCLNCHILVSQAFLQVVTAENTGGVTKASFLNSVIEMHALIISHYCRCQIPLQTCIFKLYKCLLCLVTPITC